MSNLFLSPLCLRSFRTIKCHGQAHSGGNRATWAEAGFSRYGAGTLPQCTEQSLVLLFHAFVVGGTAWAETHALQLVDQLFLLSITHHLHFLHRFFKFVHFSTSRA